MSLPIMFSPQCAHDFFLMPAPIYFNYIVYLQYFWSKLQINVNLINTVTQERCKHKAVLCSQRENWDSSHYNKSHVDVTNI